jgi:hypothetical protein
MATVNFLAALTTKSNMKDKTQFEVGEDSAIYRFGWFGSLNGEIVERIMEFD